MTATTKGKKRTTWDRPRWWVYGMLAAIVGGSMFPLYWSYVIASTTSGNANARIPVLTPGTNFLSNAAKVIDTIPFWSAMLNSVIVSTIVTVSVVFFSTLAGYAFSKLGFRGRNALFSFVVLTMAVPPQLGAGGGMPRPRNDRPASTRITAPTRMVKSTITVGMTLGST